MAGLNRAQIIGRLGQDPDLRYTQSGNMVCTLSIATSLQWRDKTSGEAREKTEWHRCVAFDKTAEIASKYLTKGRQVYVEGRLQTRKWQAQDGSDRYTTEILVEHLQLLGDRPASAPAAAASTSAPATAPSPRNAPAASAGPPDFDDDIPF
jgi:single-strand DNA-binding protein